MLRHTKLSAAAALTILLACFAAGPVRANCTNPAGKETDIIYNGDYHTYQYCNGTSWVAYGGGIGSGAMSFISTQTASNSASLQWTSIGSYNYYKLLCSNLLATSGVTIGIQFGEGGGPTWETANYEWANLYEANVGGINTGGSTSDTTIPIGNVTNPGAGLSATITLDGLGSGGSKGAELSSRTFTAGNYYMSYESGWYVGDTNAVTAIRVLAASGNIISGQCSLYGMN